MDKPRLFRESLSIVFLTLTVIATLGGRLARAQESLNWQELAALPDPEGFAGPFAGIHNDVLIVAGGANFPGKMPWDGGTKVWYDRVFLLESPEGIWQEVGKLPYPLGYGVSISTTEGIVCIGGCDADQHRDDCFRLQWKDGNLVTIPLPRLPKPCANACGALIEDAIYVAGGLDSPTAMKALKTFWSLDLKDANARWKELEPWPGSARMLATAATQNGMFFVCGGVDLKAGSDGKSVREYLRDAYSYQPGRGWKRIADLPHAAAASPSPALAFDKSTFLIVGGDDGTLVDYTPSENHPGFPRAILEYHTDNDCWRNIGDAPVGHVTTTVVDWHNRFVVPSGEVRPGKRSPSVWSLQLQK